MTVLELHNKMDAFRKYINKEVSFSYGGRGEIQLSIPNHIALKLNYINWLVTEFKLIDLTMYPGVDSYTITFKIIE